MTVSELNQKLAGHIEAWRNRPIEGKHAYVWLDASWLKRSLGGVVDNVALLVTARLRRIEGIRWGTKLYMDVNRLNEQEQEAA